MSEHCNFAVVTCKCGNQFDEECGIYAMTGGFLRKGGECEKCRKKRLRKAAVHKKRKQPS
jgi:hypothetical protein